MNNFQVYRSSAGSGKTYTLMRVYLQIVLADPAAFRSVLAITFTNKAANEIKQRIVQNLQILASAANSGIPEKYKALVADLCVSSGLDENQLSGRAGEVLSLILHNYSDFAVSTIDSFMHRIIRTFAFDLRLSGSFDVELDVGLLQAEAVEALLAEAGLNDYITGLLVEYLNSLTENDDSWHIETILGKYSEELENEKVLPFLPLIARLDAETIAQVDRKIGKWVAEYENTIKKYGAEAIGLIQSTGATEADFHFGKTGIYGYFNKCRIFKNQQLTPGARVIDTIENDKWLSAAGKKSAHTGLVNLIIEPLKQIYHSIEQFINSNQGRYKLLRMIQRTLYPLALLGELSKKLSEVRRERNVVAINEFNRIIASVVDHEPVPFIYERTGEKFRYFLIDEFQDTSVLQWRNLLPLIENSLATGGHCMVVGDGKQAIYRFRNGDADQFMRLPEIDGSADNQILASREQMLRREFKPNNLTYNFRSKHEVVNFNNDFFAFASGQLHEDFIPVYHEVAQIPRPGNTGGFVQIQFLDEASGNYEDTSKSEILTLLHKLQNEGYRPGDITLLCRTNQEASDLAAYLTTQSVKVVSSESLLLCKSPEVNFLISFLQMLSNPEDGLYQVAVARFLFQQINPNNSGLALHKALAEITSREALFHWIHDQGYTLNSNELSGFSLFDLCAHLVRIFQLQTTSPLYIRFFLDEVYQYTAGRGQSMSDFLDYWSQNTSKLTVVLPQADDAVQIMTVHKSKGLEFKVVIFSGGNINSSRNTIKSAWVNPYDDLIPELKVAHLKLTKELDDTEFQYLKDTENGKTRLDMLNMVYVAFTRAEERLYVISAIGGKGGSFNLSDLLTAYLENRNLYEAGRLVYAFGTESVAQHRMEMRLPENNGIRFHSSDWRRRLLFAGRAPRFWEAGQDIDRQSYGKLIHEILSGIQTSADTEQVVTRLHKAGIISDEDTVTVTQIIKSVITHSEAAVFFDGNGTVLTEAELLLPDGRMFRPDRVIIKNGLTCVIDFKTGAPKKEHHDQVSYYASLLKQMGYDNVQASLIYIDDPVRVESVSTSL